MSTSRNLESQTAESAYAPAIQAPAHSPAYYQSQVQPQSQYWIDALAHFFSGKPVPETVVTRLHFDSRPQTVWNAIRFYEEVVGSPSWLLRNTIPYPIRAEGHKSGPGATIRCVYIDGELIKRITALDPPHRLSFEVLRQSLGIEGVAVAQSGSYELIPTAIGTDVHLTTNYLASLRPRFLWRPLEKLITHQLHRHILRGMKSSAI